MILNHTDYRQSVYISDSRVTNISKSFIYKMAAKTPAGIDIERNHVTVTLIYLGYRRVTACSENGWNLK